MTNIVSPDNVFFNRRILFFNYPLLDGLKIKKQQQTIAKPKCLQLTQGWWKRKKDVHSKFLRCVCPCIDVGGWLIKNAESVLSVQRHCLPAGSPPALPPLFNQASLFLSPRSGGLKFWSQKPHAQPRFPSQVDRFRFCVNVCTPAGSGASLFSPHKLVPRTFFDRRTTLTHGGGSRARPREESSSNRPELG